MPQKPRIHNGQVVENPGPTVFFYAGGDGPVTFPRSSLNLSKLMATKLIKTESADFLEADLGTVQCIATYMCDRKYVCPVGLETLSPISKCIASFKAALNVAPYAMFLELPDLLKQVNEHIDMCEDSLSYTLRLEALVDSGSAMNLLDLVPKIDEVSRDIIRYAPADRYASLLDGFGVPETWGRLYLMSLLSNLVEGDCQERAFERTFEGMNAIMPTEVKTFVLSHYYGIKLPEYERFEIEDFTNEVNNNFDDAGVADIRHGRRTEHGRIRPLKMKRGKQARARQIRKKKNGARS